MLSIGCCINEIRIDGDLTVLGRDLASFTACGMTAAEIAVHGTDAIKNGRLDQRRTAEVRRILADFPLRYSVHAPNPLNLMHATAADLHQQVLRAALEFTALIGGECLVYHPGRYRAEEDFLLSPPLLIAKDQRQRLLDAEAIALQKAADDYPEVLIGMENARPYQIHSPYCYAELPSQLARQIKAIGRRNVCMTLDFGHLHMAAAFYGLDEHAEVQAVAGLIGHCHVHDNFGHLVACTEKIQTHLLPFGRGDMHMPVGWGDIDFAGLFAPFIDGYDGLLICELRARYLPATCEAVANLHSVLQQVQ